MKKIVFSFVLIHLVLFQSCVVYQTTPTPIYESVDKGKVKIISKTGEISTFRCIELIDSIYFGFNRQQQKNEMGISKWIEVKVPLNGDQLLFYLKDKKISNKQTVFLVISTISVVYLVAAFAVISGFGG